MEFTFSEEHDQLRSTVRQFLTERSDEQAVREQMESDRGFDDAVWKQMAQELGLQGLIVPEEHGGAGFGPVELGIVLEEMGRALLCAPYLSTAVLAVNALREAARVEAQRALLPGIAAGETIATLAFAEPGGRWDAAGIAMRANPEDGAWRLDGVKAPVLDGHLADLLLVAARTDDGLALFQVEADAEGLTRMALPVLDPTRKLARLELLRTKAERLSPPGDHTNAIDRAIDLTTAGLVAEQVGGSQRCLDMAVEYAKTRLQFGRPIGSFQAIKHRCASLLIEVEFARSAAYYAGFCAASEEKDLAGAVSLAKSYCSEAYNHASGDNIQIHGGMGFTWEHPAHLYLKRARSSATLFGDPAHHRERLADHIGA